MLKAEELSIGDWVKILDYHWDGSPYVGQVNGITKKHGTYYLHFGSALSAEIDRCEPISITPDALLKNGFREEDNDCFLWKENLERVIWFVGGFTTITSVRCDEMYEGYCYDVHELQHAMRICGITKNIEL